MDHMRQMAWKGVRKEAFDGIYTFSGMQAAVFLEETEFFACWACYAHLQKHGNYVGDGEEGDRERGGMKDSGVPNGRLST